MLSLAQKLTFKEAHMNGDAIIKRMAEKISQLIVENEILRQELIEEKESQNGIIEQNTES